MQKHASDAEEIPIETSQSKTEKNTEKIEESIGELWEISGWTNIHVIEISVGEDRVEDRKIIWSDNGWILTKFYENCKPIDPRCSVDPKHKKHEENYTKTLHNQNT